MSKYLFIFSLFFAGITQAQNTPFRVVNEFGESPLVSFTQFEMLADSVEPYRAKRLVSTQKFVDLSKESNTVILDTRSKVFFEKKHVKGAINLPFADFTQSNLEALIPDKNTRILIYCNNNFVADLNFNTGIMIQDMNFASKTGGLNLTDIKFTEQLYKFDTSYQIKPNLETKYPDTEAPVEVKRTEKYYTLALNIPTFINLYGYGYQNVYELADLVATRNSKHLEFEGTDVKTVHPDIVYLDQEPIPSTLVSYSDIQELIDLVKPHRQERLVSLDQFNQMKQENNTVILDTRSKEMYDAMHVKGAIHLEFSDFTQNTLDSLLKDRNTRVLIYCNNNFMTDIQLAEQNRYFMSKVSKAPPKWMEELTLALNIPTYINLYGYGYENVYELGELVVTSDSRIQFEGTSIK